MAASVENVVGIEDALRHLDAAGLELGNELRPDAGGDVAAVDAALAVGRFAAEAEDLLHGDHVALHAGDFLQADEASPTVANRSAEGSGGKACVSTVRSRWAPTYLK